ncbi:MAG TPA: hypothetical protein VEX15_03870 [Nocardioidaceae bacterium]|nr:hypothetical protein [Nocardioidaceae bacterium]
MRRRRVRAPDGRSWVVRRRWMPRLGAGTAWSRLRGRSRRSRRSTKHAETAGDVSLFTAFIVDDFAVVVRWVVIVVVATLLIVLSAFAAIVEVALLVLLVLVGILTRFLLDRPWTIEATPDDGEALKWQATGWRSSAERLSQVATLLESGITPPPDAPAS